MACSFCCKGVKHSTSPAANKGMRKKPWNRVNLPVYSISSQDASGRHNMHMITYVTAISMQPKRIVCGIYKGTQTLENVQSQKRFVLQLLADHQYNLTRILGKTSGKKSDKIKSLQKKNLLTPWLDHLILTEALSVMELEVIQEFDGGDHVGFLCDVTQYKNCRPGDALTLDVLRAHRLIII